MSIVVDLAGFKVEKASRKAGECKHHHVVVDERKNQVECHECHVMLNPIWVLNMLATETDWWKRQHETMVKDKKEQEQRERCRCEYCGQMTRI